MPHRKVQFKPGGIYHLFNRGVDGIRIFRHAGNYRFFTQRMRQYRQELAVAVMAYCLMPNHYHLMVRQETDVSAGLLPQVVCNSYAKAFNREHSRKGPLFQWSLPRSTCSRG